MLFLIFQSLSAVIYFFIALLIAFTPYRFRYRVITSWSKLVIWLARVICGLEYDIEGLENIPEKPAILLCNHQSAWETLFLQVLLPYQCWVLKKSLLYIPFFGWGLALLEPIAIDRKKSASVKQLIRQGKKRLQQGRWIVIFPEGSRVLPGETKRFSRSGASLSQATQTPILPVAHNAGVFWPKNSFIKNPGKIKVIIGKPISPEGKTIDEIYEESTRWIQDKLKSF